eukprot:s707_g6.t1
MASPRDVSPPPLRRNSLHDRDYAPVETDVAGECRRLLGCNLAVAMLCVLFTICCLVVTVIMDPVSSKAGGSAPRLHPAPHLAPSPATESWDPSPDASFHSPSPAPAPRTAPDRTSPWPQWPQWPTTAPRSTPRPTRAPPMVLITGPPDAMEGKPREDEVKAPSLSTSDEGRLKEFSELGSGWVLYFYFLRFMMAVMFIFVIMHFPILIIYATHGSLEEWSEPHSFAPEAHPRPTPEVGPGFCILHSAIRARGRNVWVPAWAIETVP